MAPSKDMYITEIRRLLVSYQMQQSEEHKFAILSITSAAGSEQYMQMSSIIQGVMDHNRVSELIAYFAQRIGGIYIRLGSGEYIIFCNYQELLDETGNLSRFDLLANVYSQTAYTLSIGIGVGNNLKRLYFYAQIGERRALREHGNRVYVVYSPTEMVGPIESNEINKPSNTLFDKHLVMVAETSSLSINTIFKLDTLIKQKPNRSFITSEIAQELEISGRTANRIITKLELKGYVMEIGRSITGEKGRPTRVFRAMW
jgi:predicted transcriptional regulator